MAGVVSNLLYPPNINLTQNGSLLESESDDVLTYTLSGSITGVFNCTVCIEVQEAYIMNHCNSSTVTITEDGESFMLIHVYTSIHILSTVPEQITPVKQVVTESQITIKWTKTSEDIVRYVLDVREYSSAGPGETKNESIISYPREIPATETQYTVTSLSELHTSRYNSDYVFPYPFPVPLTLSFSLTLSPLQSLGSHMNTYLWLGMYMDVENSTIHLLSSLRKNVCYVAHAM